MQDDKTYTREEMDKIVFGHIQKNTKLLQQELNKQYKEVEYA